MTTTIMMVVLLMMMFQSAHIRERYCKSTSTFSSSFLVIFEAWIQHLCLFLYVDAQVKAKFTVDDHRHYLFTPCVLTEWVLSLLRYDLTAGNKTETLSHTIPTSEMYS